MKLKCPASDIDAFQDDPAVIKGPSQNLNVTFLIPTELRMFSPEEIK